ncbi:hypothetical protein JCM10914A_45370 [Paenibacillus sp. JCM 10914]|uniref:hypothetical protein n=1 Tax=Paenibacillus sp. JCM 10914 TaxID=1236974 RepID=UPI000AAA68AB|nr:hypothetical protein [Paenibacillus sp. JCM 10914]
MPAHQDAHPSPADPGLKGGVCGAEMLHRFLQIGDIVQIAVSCEPKAWLGT